MTMEPLDTNGKFPDPVSCPLHAKALEEIKGIVLETRAEVRGLKEIGGPIVSLDKFIGSVEAKTVRLHERVDIHDLEISTTKKEVKLIKEDQNKLIVKVGAILAPIAAAIGGAIAALGR